MNIATHGGDRAAAEARFGRPAAGWIDLSTSLLLRVRRRFRHESLFESLLNLAIEVIVSCAATAWPTTPLPRSGKRCSSRRRRIVIGCGL
jgi:hypothetical protein